MDPGTLKIGITGSDGLLGWHLRAYLHGERLAAETRCATRATFADEGALGAFAGGLDAIVHMAGMNRGPDSDLERTNRELVEALIAACERAGSAPHVVFSSSTHIDRDTAYGRSKRECAARLAKWCDDRGAAFTNLILPHVFGEFGKPFYNSVVSTFCHQLANDAEPAIDVDGELHLLHAQDVAALAVRCIVERTAGDVRVPGNPLRVSALLAKLQRFSTDYKHEVLPDLPDPLDVRLFNTYRSYLYPAHYPVRPALRSDERGALFEAVRSRDGGQAFLSWTHPGVTRGNHYHRRKVERFLVVQGEGLVCIRKLFSDRTHEFRLDGSVPQFVDMPTFHTHNITNTGKSELLTLFWSNEIFDPADPDTYSEKVDQP